VFSGLRTDQLARVRPFLRWLHFGAGQTVFAAGDPANRLYVVVCGEVSIRYHPYDGGCVEVATVRQDGAFGWSAILKRDQYTATAVCRTDVEALAIHTDNLQCVLAADVAMGDRLLENLGQLAANRAEGLGRHVIRLLQSDDGSR
jgi:CRP-like cAMP-binding protein